jgi:hypothetical protein
MYYSGGCSYGYADGFFQGGIAYGEPGGGSGGVSGKKVTAGRSGTVEIYY